MRNRIVGFYGALALLSGAIMWPQGISPWWSGSWLALTAEAAGGAAVGLTFVLLSRWAEWTFHWAEGLALELRGMVAHIGPSGALVAALSSGLAEEAFFRGVLQPAIGVVLSATVFGLMHMGPSRRLRPWPLLAVGAGLALGLLYQETGTLVAPTVAHVVTNYLNLRHLLTPRAPPALTPTWNAP
jgi:membrane protease YdiL (CAAX protease family)